MSYIFHGITGARGANIFNMPHCETDRFWRKQLALTPERYWKYDQPLFDECRNAYMKPKKPVSISILDHLHKRSDYENGTFKINPNAEEITTPEEMDAYLETLKPADKEEADGGDEGDAEDAGDAGDDE